MIRRSTPKHPYPCQLYALWALDRDLNAQSQLLRINYEGEVAIAPLETHLKRLAHSLRPGKEPHWILEAVNDALLAIQKDRVVWGFFKACGCKAAGSNVCPLVSSRLRNALLLRYGHVTDFRSRKKRYGQHAPERSLLHYWMKIGRTEITRERAL